MTRLLVLALCAAFLPADGLAEIKRWRVGDDAHPWNLRPVTGRLDLGRSWSVELLADDDGLLNEDPPDPQIDNDGDGQLNEDPTNNIDDDGDGLIDEDPPELFDNDLDGLIDEDGPDPQIDNDGDGQLNEDGLYTNFDDDWDAVQNEDPIDGIDNDGDGLIDEDPEFPAHGSGITTWLRPVLLDSLRNLAYLIDQRYKAGEFGGIVPGKAPQAPFMTIPSEYGSRLERGDPFISGNSGGVLRTEAERMIDGDFTTAWGSSRDGLGGLLMMLNGYYYINRIIFRPRPTLPANTIANYYIRYADQTNVDSRAETLAARRTLIPVLRGQFNPVVKDHRFDPPVVTGRIDVVSIDPKGTFVETAEAGFFGDGYAIDGIFISEIIDVGPTTPRFRRYDREIEQFSGGERDAYEDQFTVDLAGAPVNWGKVRWRARRDGRDGDVRIQFRVGNTLDTHIYARRLGPGLFDTKNSDGSTLDLFSWIKLAEGRIPYRELQYNELGIDLGEDGRKGWSFWSAPFKLEDGLIDESVPESEWSNTGVQLPLPGGTRYIQFRIFYDSSQHSAALLDFIEFDYDAPLVSGGVVAEIFPPRVPLGEETAFRLYVRPLFSDTDAGGFNRIEIAVPSADTRIDTLRFDGQDWSEITGTDAAATDPLLGVEPMRMTPPAGSADSLGQFVQTVVTDPSGGSPKLLIKLPQMKAEHFQFGQNIEIVFRSKLFRGSKEFTSSVWNDETGDLAEVIPQPAANGDATPDVATNALLVVVDEISNVVKAPNITPNPFTPNGDGINDEVTFSFDLFLLLEQVDVQLEIYDLSGRRVTQLQMGGSTAGNLEIKWDGRDQDGQMTPPGIYLYRLAVDSDDSSIERSGTLSLVY